MTRDGGLDRLVEEFLELRERDERLTPETFAAGHASAGPELLARLRATLAAEAQLREGADSAPERVGPYRVVRALGRGGMGVVHEVEKDGARFALKRMHPALVGPRAAERFQREGRILARLKHPGIVGVHAIGSAAGEPHLVLELVDGRALPGAAQGLDLAGRVRIVIAVARAVQAAHEAGLVHRDLKPGNVLLRGDGSPVLVDFGLGGAEGEASLTSTGDVLGTPRYMAPEQALGRAADPRTDVWGLGQILFELATGRAAVDEGSRSDVLRAVCEGRLLDPRALVPAFPRALVRVLATALALEPHHRYATARDFADDLERFLAGEPVRASPPGALVRLAQSARRHPARAGVGATLVLILLVAGTWALVARNEELRTRRASARGITEQAVLAWTLGEGESARRTTDRALAVADDPAARALREVLDGSTDPSAAGWRAGFSAAEAGDHGRAARAFEVLAATDALAGVLLARAQRLAGDVAAAERSLAARGGERGAPLVAAFERAAIARDRADTAGVVAEIAAVRPLAPDDVHVGRALAGALFEAGRVAEGMDVAVDVHDRGLASGESGIAELARILRRVPGRSALRAELERRLQADPARASLRFALALLHDADHDVAGAGREYERLLADTPDHGYGLAYLAHLRAGADRGRCGDCDRAFAAAPESLDEKRAQELLARAVEADRGRDAELLRTIVVLARDHRSEAPVVAALERVLADGTSVARPRLEDALTSLRRAPPR